MPRRLGWDQDGEGPTRACVASPVPIEKEAFPVFTGETGG